MVCFALIFSFAMIKCNLRDYQIVILLVFSLAFSWWTSTKTKKVSIYSPNWFLHQFELDKEVPLKPYYSWKLPWDDSCLNYILVTNNFLPFQKYTLAIGTMLRKSLVCCSWAPNIERKGKRTISSIQTHVLMFYTMLKKVKNCSCRVLLQSIGQKGNKQLADIQLCLEQLFSMLSKWSTVKNFKKDVTQTS